MRCLDISSYSYSSSSSSDMKKVANLCSRLNEILISLKFFELLTADYSFQVTVKPLLAMLSTYCRNTSVPDPESQTYFVFWTELKPEDRICNA